MAYNNGFPIGYQPAQIYYPQQMPQVQQPMQQMQQSNNLQSMMSPPTIHAEIIQVDNEQMAENHPLSAGASQMMIAKDDSAIFVKTMYANGQYNLDVYTKRPSVSKKTEIDPSLYVTRQEFEDRITALMKNRNSEKLKEDKDVDI